MMRVAIEKLGPRRRRTAGWAAVVAAVLLLLGSAWHIATSAAAEPGPALESLFYPGWYAIGMLLAVAGAVILRGSGDDDATSVAVRERLDRAELEVRDRRALMHEIGATVSGIAFAAQLIDHRRAFSPTQQRLQAMLDAEIARLNRMTGERSSDLSEVIDLDETIRHLVTAQEVQGHRVEWSPTGCLVEGRADDVAQIIHTLLQNAVGHGRSIDVALHASSVGDVVEIVVADGGPGLSPLAREHLYEWAAPGDDSRGEGIGLHLARALACRNGGSLELLETDRGTAFVVSLPTMRANHGHLAQRAG